MGDIEMYIDSNDFIKGGYTLRWEDSKWNTYKVNGKWECRKGQYYTHSLRDEEHFPVVGNVKINILGYVMGEMLDALERRTDE